MEASRDSVLSFISRHAEKAETEKSRWWALGLSGLAIVGTLTAYVIANWPTTRVPIVPIAMTFSLALYPLFGYPVVRRILNVQPAAGREHPPLAQISPLRFACLNPHGVSLIGFGFAVMFAGGYSLLGIISFIALTLVALYSIAIDAYHLPLIAPFAGLITKVPAFVGVLLGSLAVVISLVYNRALQNQSGLGLVALIIAIPLLFSSLEFIRWAAFDTYAKLLDELHMRCLREGELGLEEFSALATRRQMGPIHEESLDAFFAATCQEKIPIPRSPSDESAT